MVGLISTTAAIPYLSLTFPRVYQSPICDNHNTMAETKPKPAILIVSDTASQNPASDKTVDALSTSFAAAGPGAWESPVTKIVPDSVLDIQRTICDWTDGPNWFNLILVSGGTGFAAKDNTPEVGWYIYIWLSCANWTRPYHLSSIAMRRVLCGSRDPITSITV